MGLCRQKGSGVSEADLLAPLGGRVLDRIHGLGIIGVRPPHSSCALAARLPLCGAFCWVEFPSIPAASFGMESAEVAGLLQSPTPPTLRRSADGDDRR